MTEFGVGAAGVGELDRSESTLDDFMHTESDHADHKRCFEYP